MQSTRKKIWIFLCAILVILLAIAVLLPLQSNVYQQTRFHATGNALSRQLLKDTVWHNWWPGKVIRTGDSMILSAGKFTFLKRQTLLNNFIFTASSGSWSFQTTLTLIPQSNDEVIVSLSSVILLPTNPVERIKGLFLSSQLKEIFNDILNHLAGHFSLIRNLYGVDISESSVLFEYVATTSKTLDHRARVSEVYEVVDELKDYIRQNHAEEKGFPMLHENSFKPNEHYIQVAIPIDRQLPDKGMIKSKWLLKGGQILKTEVKGNRKKIAKAMTQVEYYIQDHNHARVAIPYQYLITNRLEQPDSAQWVTGIYYPVILH